MSFKDGERLKLIIENGNVKEIIGKIIKKKEILKEEEYGKIIYDGYFFYIEDIIWETDFLEDRNITYYCGTYFYDKEKNCIYTQFESIKKFAKKIEKIEEVGI